MKLRNIILITCMASSLTTAWSDEIKCSKKVSSRHEKLIMKDLERLKSLNFSSEQDEESLKILGVQSVDSQSMYQWLTDRVQYIIDDREPIDKLKLDIAQNFYQYPNHGVIPDMELPGRGPVLLDKIESHTANQGAVTVMSNIGTVLYLAGKSANQLLQVKIPLSLFKSDKILVTSPRTGVIQIGEGLFMKKFMFNEKDSEAVSNSLSRLLTFFHEARHSDGNGKSTGFLHALCPQGHDFAGLSACDRNLNGPYTVGKIMAKEFLKACSDCSESEKEKIRLNMIDSESRVLKTTVLKKTGSGAEASLYQTMIDMYERLLPITRDEATRKSYLEKIEELRQKISELGDTSSNLVEVPSKFWDARPEGNR